MMSRFLKSLTVFILSFVFVFSSFNLTAQKANAQTVGSSPDSTFSQGTDKRSCETLSTFNNTRVWVASEKKCYYDCNYTIAQYGQGCPGSAQCTPISGTYDNAYFCSTSGIAPVQDKTSCSNKGWIYFTDQLNTGHCVPCNSPVIQDTKVIPDVTKISTGSRENGGCGSDITCQVPSGSTYGVCTKKTSTTTTTPGGTPPTSGGIATSKDLEVSAPNTVDLGSARGCKFDTQNVGHFAANNIGALLVLVGAGTAAGGLSGIPFVGGLAKSLSNAIDHVIQNYIDAISLAVVAGLSLIATGWLIEKGLEFNTDLTTNNALIKAGFDLTLGIANIGFVITLIVVGIATILRKQQYGSTKTLINLVIAILLVNFSIFIVTFLSKISDVFTSAFIGSTCPSFSLVNQLGAWNVQGNIISTGSQWTQAALAPLTIYLAVGINFIGLLIALIIAVYLFIRYFIMSLLIVAMPIAWLGFIFPQINIPGFGNPWKYWWDNFVKWLIAGPMVAFFLYLIPAFLDAIGKVDPNNFSITKSLTSLVGVAILGVGGVMVTNKMSGVGSALISTGATSALGFGMKAVTGLRQRAFGGQALEAQEKQKQLDIAAQTGGFGAKFKAAAYGKFAGATTKGAAGFETPLMGAVLGQAGVKKGALPTVTTTEAFKKSFGDPSKFKLGDKTYDQLTKGEALAELNRLEETSRLTGDTVSLREQKLALMRKLGKEGALNKVSLANVYGKNLDTELKKYGVDFDKEFVPGLGINRSAYEHLSNVNNQERAIFDTIGRKNAIKKRLNDLDESRRFMATYNSEVAQIDNDLTAARRVGDNDAILALETRRNTLENTRNNSLNTITSLSPQELELRDQVNAMEKEIVAAQRQKNASEQVLVSEISSMYKKMDKKAAQQLPINELLADYNPAAPSSEDTPPSETATMREAVLRSLASDPKQITSIAPIVKGENYEKFVNGLLMETINSQAGSDFQYRAMRVVDKATGRPVPVSIKAARKDPSKYNIEEYTATEPKANLKDLKDKRTREIISSASGDKSRAAFERLFKNI